MNKDTLKTRSDGSTAPPETIEINWESAADVGVEGAPGEAEIDWGAVGVIEGGIDAAVDFEVVGDSKLMTSVDDGEIVAVGKDALSLLGKAID